MVAVELAGPADDVRPPDGMTPLPGAPEGPEGRGIVQAGVPPPRLGDLAKRLEGAALAYEARLGVGTCLVAVERPGEVDHVRAWALELGGHAVVIDGPDDLRADPWGPEPPGVHLMRRLRDAFDPAGVLNPGNGAVGVTSNWDASLPAPAEEDVVKCVACGLCLPHCPTFRLTGRETASPRGRIAAMRAVEEGHAVVDASFTTMMDECLACRACEAACPSGVPFGRMIEAARAQAEPTRAVTTRGVKRLGLAGVLPHRHLVMAAGWLLGVVRALRLDRLAPAAQRASIPPVSLRELLEPIPRSLGSGPTAKVLSGCVMDVAFRPTQRATMRAVAAAGFRAERTPSGACCGALAMHYGQPEAAKRMARERVAELEGAEMIVVNASGCSAHLKAYGELLADDPVWAQRAERVAERTRDLIEISLAPG